MLAAVCGLLEECEEEEPRGRFLGDILQALGRLRARWPSDLAGPALSALRFHLQAVLAREPSNPNLMAHTANGLARMCVEEQARAQRSQRMGGPAVPEPCGWSGLGSVCPSSQALLQALVAASCSPGATPNDVASVFWALGRLTY